MRDKSLSTVLLSFNEMCQKVVRKILYLSYWRSVKLSFRVNDIYILNE